LLKTQILNELRFAPCTKAELSSTLEINLQTLGGRLSELSKDGLIQKIEDYYHHIKKPELKMKNTIDEQIKQLAMKCKIADKEAKLKLLDKLIDITTGDISQLLIDIHKDIK